MSSRLQGSYYRCVWAKVNFSSHAEWTGGDATRGEDEDEEYWQVSGLAVPVCVMTPRAELGQQSYHVNHFSLFQGDPDVRRPQLLQQGQAGLLRPPEAVGEEDEDPVRSHLNPWWSHDRGRGRRGVSPPLPCPHPWAPGSVKPPLPLPPQSSQNSWAHLPAWFSDLPWPPVVSPLANPHVYYSYQ